MTLLLHLHFHTNYTHPFSTNGNVHDVTPLHCLTLTNTGWNILASLLAVYTRSACNKHSLLTKWK